MTVDPEFPPDEPEFSTPMRAPGWQRVPKEEEIGRRDDAELRDRLDEFDAMRTRGYVESHFAPLVPRRRPRGER